jgi:hypothetical protein
MKNAVRKEFNISEIVTIVFLSFLVILGAIYYASCYYRDNFLSFTQEDSFIFNIIIIFVVLLGVITIVLSYTVALLQRDIKELKKLNEAILKEQINNQAEIMTQFDNVTNYTIESTKRIISNSKNNSNDNYKDSKDG